jgi:hypothetical protein
MAYYRWWSPAPLLLFWCHTALKYVISFMVMSPLYANVSVY